MKRPKRGSSALTVVVERCSQPVDDFASKKVMVERRSHTGSKLSGAGSRSVVTGGHYE